MVTIKKILCPVDFFPASDRAVKYAAGLARSYDASLHLLHVIAPLVTTAYEYPINTYDIIRSMETASGREMKKLEAKLKAMGVDVRTEVRTGNIQDAIKRSIATVKPDLIAMGTHGRRGVERWLMGSVTEWLMRHTPVPVITLSARGRLKQPVFKRILVTTDFSEGTNDALSYAFSIAQENDSRISLMHVVNDLAVEPPGRYRRPLVTGVQKQLEDLIPPEAANWCDIDVRVEEGLPYQVILSVLKREKPDLLVMNIHGKGMLDRALLGSTAERVVRAAECPVMLIPPISHPKARKKPRSARRAA
jgi:nucleotide-binding universal stress UspA family protein